LRIDRISCSQDRQTIEGAKVEGWFVETSRLEEIKPSELESDSTFAITPTTASSNSSRWPIF